VTAPDIGARLAALVGESQLGDGGALDAFTAPPTDDDEPSWLVTPGSAAEIADVVRLAHEESLAVVPVGNAARAPRMSSLRDRARIYVDIRRMDHVLHLDETSLVAHVQAGITAIALEKILSPRGLSMGDHPPATLGSTIGGLLSVRTPGKASPRHGFIGDAVIGISAVLSDGRTIHTRVAPRRSTGPDLARALLGSEGTLGLITSAVLRIHRRPEARYLAAHGLPDVDAALAAVRLALREEAAPAAARVYDTAEARAHLGAIDIRDGEAVLVVATAGPTDLAACDRDLVASASDAMNGRPLAEAVARTWWEQRTGQGGSVPLPQLELSAAPRALPHVYHAVVDAATAAGARARAHISRFYADGAVLFATFTNQSGTPLDEATAGPLCHAVKEAATAAGAYLLGSTNAQLEPYFQHLRHELDPKGILNPGVL